MDTFIGRYNLLFVFIVLLTLMGHSTIANGCFNKHQLLKMQGTNLSEMTSFMQMEGWRFAGVSELARQDHFGQNTPNQAVQWVQGYDSEQVYFYDNKDAGNFIVLVLSEYCHSSLFSEFSAEQNGITSVLNGALLTTFSQGGIRIEFSESANSGNRVIRIYEKGQLEKYKLNQSSTSGPLKEEPIHYLNGEGPVPTTEVITLQDLPMEQKIEEPVSFAQEMPQYPGGELQMQKDIMENAPYPEMEKENNIQGKVYVQFVVEKDGTVSNVRVQRGVQGGPNLSRVAENAVRKLKRFTPAMQNGRPVRVIVTHPVNFTLK